MKPGDLIQIQKPFRVQQCGHQIMNRLKDYELFPTLSLQPGEVYLITEFHIGREHYPIYNFFEITILAEGKQWASTITIEHDNEIADYIKVFESPTLLPRG